MSTATKIQWAEHSWNCLRGCSRVSAGCDNCYAIAQAHRFSGPDMPFAGLTVIRQGRPDFAGHVMLVEKDLMVPLRRKKPTRYFVNSVSDVFHHGVPFNFIDKMFAVMALCPQHQFLILTKRPERMREYLSWTNASGFPYDWQDRLVPIQNELQGRPRMTPGMTRGMPLPNVWLGISAENQETYNKRIVHLLKTPAAVHFVSLEPLLGPIGLAPWKAEMLKTAELARGINILGTPATVRVEHMPRLDWAIIGGESGPRARPCNLAWIYDLVRQCREANIATFVKQLGAVPYISDEVWRQHKPTLLLNARNCHKVTADQAPLKFSDKKGGNMEEWPEDLRVREYPMSEVEA